MSKSNDTAKAPLILWKNSYWILFLYLSLVPLFACPLSMPLWAALLLSLPLSLLLYLCLFALKLPLLLKNGLKGKHKEEAALRERNRKTAYNISLEGITLLQNRDALLPLAPGSKLNLIGLRAIDPVYNGGGSAASNTRHCISPEAGLKAAGFALNEELLSLSKQQLKKNNRPKEQTGGAEFTGSALGRPKEELPVSLLLDSSLWGDGRNALERAQGFSDTALLFLSRIGGEGFDFQPRDLQLSESEKALLSTVCLYFNKVILVLNCCNSMEMSFLKAYPAIKGILWMGFAGETGMLALGDILRGKVSPSGHTADTWVYTHSSIPAVHNHLQADGQGGWKNDSFHYTDAPKGKDYFVHYHEGIYMGYRYFETRSACDPHYAYDKEVLWPFGHGLSYTSFQQSILSLQEQDKQLLLRCRVKNTGSVTGRCLLQLYAAPPYTGAIEKSTVVLVGFCKTRELSPLKELELILRVDKRRLASFCSKEHCFLLEEGLYTLSLRENAHEPICTVPWVLKASIRYPTCMVAFEDGETDSLNRDFPKDHPAFTGHGEDSYPVPSRAETAEDPVCSAPPVVKQHRGWKLKDMQGIPKTDPRWQQFVEQLSIKELCSLCANGAWQIKAQRTLGVSRSLCPDGPVSLSATVFSALAMQHSKKGVSWPGPCVLACSFNRELAKDMGDGIGKEATLFGYTGWYAPAMNLHRTPYNSRNFEYYSEDPLLSGVLAAETVKCFQAHGKIAFIKHFVLNERETNARSRLYSYCSEQALRELYLRPFEIAIREGGALGIMTSFNYLGTLWTGSHEGLLTELLRKEWGFKGVITTDACVYPYMDAVKMLHAGGDLILDSFGAFLGQSSKETKLLKAAYSDKNAYATVHALQRAAKDILYALCCVYY